jgi:hypothetical protein
MPSAPLGAQASRRQNIHDKDILYEIYDICLTRNILESMSAGRSQEVTGQGLLILRYFGADGAMQI